MKTGRFLKPSSGNAYALKALVDVTLHQGIGPVTLKSIAKRQQIPLRYLEQLFNRLRREGIVAAARGPRGGYRLGRPASEIPVSAIFECLAERDADATAVSRGAAAASDPTETVWKQVKEAVQSTLEATTLEALVAQALEKAPTPFDHRFTFHI